MRTQLIYRPLLGTLLAVSLLLSPVMRPPTANAASLLTASVTRAGITVTVSVPHRSYPRNAVIPVTVTVSLTPQLAATGTDVLFGASCTNYVPAVAEILDVHHHPVDPLSALPSMPPTPLCPGPGPYEMMPRDRYSGVQYVILAGSRVAAQTAPVLEPTAAPGAPGSTTGPPLTVQTPELHLRLTNAPKPWVSIKHNPLRAVIHDPHATSQLVAAEWESCPGIPYPSSTGAVMVPQAPGRVLHPQCAAPTEWHAVAGYLGRPVTVINVYPTVHKNVRSRTAP
jgi:hypothetical protein